MQIPKAIVLATPTAWRHRRITRSQYALVGVRASPTQDKPKIRRQTRKIGRLPILSAIVPQNMGATIFERLAYLGTSNTVSFRLGVQPKKRNHFKIRPKSKDDFSAFSESKNSRTPGRNGTINDRTDRCLALSCTLLQ